MVTDINEHLRAGDGAWRGRDERGGGQSVANEAQMKPKQVKGHDEGVVSYSACRL